ncbi:MAG: hypothetical protein K9H16_06635 [Bacteroidales bacterium]|nr:hypothetical protein [Bacteroidales bacterium]
MKNLFVTFVIISINLLGFSQYQTPGTGVNWDLNDLVANSGGVVTIETNEQYIIHENLTISTLDTFSIVFGEEIMVADDVLITVNGIMICDPLSGGVIFFKAQNDHYLGFRFENSHGSDLKATYFKKAGGIQLVNSDMAFYYCNFTEFNQENTTGTVNLFQSSPIIEYCSFSDNDGPAVMSGATSTSSPQILNCEMFYNVASNSNTPQINLGTSGTDSIRIINCEIIGNPENIMAGGIAITTLAGGSLKTRVEGNIIRDNRYGITCYGSNIGSVIRGNEIVDNNTQNQPMLGGSGINFFGTETNQSLVSGNIITGNLWGITIQGTAQPNFGQLEGEIYNPGANTFMNNGNEGEIYDLYNNTPNTIMAQNNYWGTINPDTVEMHIFHQPDDPSLGLIEFLPLYLPPVGLDNFSSAENQTAFSVYPNPANGYFYLMIDEDMISDAEPVYAELLNLAGETLCTFSLPGTTSLHRLTIPEGFSGMALVKVSIGKTYEIIKVRVAH